MLHDAVCDLRSQIQERHQPDLDLTTLVIITKCFFFLLFFMTPLPSIFMHIYDVYRTLSINIFKTIYFNAHFSEWPKPFFRESAFKQGRKKWNGTVTRSITKAAFRWHPFKPWVGQLMTHHANESTIALQGWGSIAPGITGCLAAWVYQRLPKQADQE